MFDENKRNVQYFESSSIKELFNSVQAWQNENNKRFLSLSVERDRDKFCCIALTNPTEVVIKDYVTGAGGARVENGALRVTGR